MAYNQHPLNTSQSHYNKPALVVILLIFLGIIAFVVVKQLFPELATSLGVNSEKQTNPLVSDVSPIPVTTSTPEGTKLAPNGNKSQSQSVGEKSAVAPKTNPTATGVSCTQDDISAGLCKH